MLVYWGQSIIIGIAYFFRILNLKRFKSDVSNNTGKLPENSRTKTTVAFMHAWLYAFCHVIYLIFLVVRTEMDLALDTGFWISLAIFSVNHFWSYRYHFEVDRQGKPSLSAIFLVPYIRILPMHLTIISGLDWGLVKFVILKTIADMVMHLVEHAMLRKAHEYDGEI